MKLLDRYITRQLLVTCGFAVVTLSLVLVLGNIFKKLLDLLVNHDVPIGFILSFIAYVLPFSLTFTIPWGFLTAVLLVFGKLSAENELTALRSNGVSLIRISIPVMLLALLLSAVCLWINVDVAPRAQQKMKNTLYEIATSNPIAMFGSDQVISEFPGKKIYVGNKQGKRLEDILVFELNEDDVPMRVVHAQQGELMTDLEEERVLLKLYDARFEQRDDVNPHKHLLTKRGITWKEGVFPISLTELYEKNRRRRGLSSMTLTELNEDRRQAAEMHSESARLTEMNKRFSFSMACIAFGLIGLPLGITANRRETSIGFAISLATAFVYFMFIIVADTFRHNAAAHPELLIWLPNFIFVGMGAVLFVRMTKK